MKITLELEGGLLWRFEQGVRITGEAPVRMVKRILSEWLAENLPKITEEQAARERLRGRVPCQTKRALILKARDARGLPRNGRWERGEVAWLEPEVARKYARKGEVEILPPPKDDEAGDD
jgi:hypothetical protein